MEYYTVVGNENPSLEIQLKRDNVIIDLTTATNVDLILKNARTQAIVNTGRQTCNITQPASGIVEYDQETGDFTESGTYIGDVEVTYSDTEKERLYQQLIVFARDK
jgi:hypothetical protein